MAEILSRQKKKRKIANYIPIDSDSEKRLEAHAF